MKINIDSTLEITLEWSGDITDKNAFLYLVAFKLTNGEITELRDVIFRDTKKEDGFEYSGVKKSIISSSNRLTQILKLDTKGIRNTITDIIFLLFSFKADNLAKGKLFVNKKNMEYKLSDSLHLCIEFGRMKRCSSYWELDLYSLEYKSIETPYRLFASKNLKNNYYATDVFNLKKKIEMPDVKEVSAFLPEECKSGTKMDGDYKREYVPQKTNFIKRGHSHGTMPESKKNLQSIKNKKNEDVVSQEETTTETTTVTSVY